ncbi:MAG TPA: hypothetical protein VHE33_00595, partial [Acidobacteriaceae bacterium]|nr:hypothetical protein [Acidobacteriaceae bacterium]
NVLNFGNFGGPDGVVLTPDDNGAGLTNVNSPYGTGAAAFDIKNTERTPRRTGTFGQGSPRATEFQLTFNF